MGKNIFYFVIAIAFLLAIGGIIFYLVQPQPSSKQEAVSPVQQVEEKPQGLGGEIYEQVQNPAEDIPETNPFGTETNPFEAAETNPFEEGYKNPFE